MIKYKCGDCKTYKTCKNKQKILPKNRLACLLFENSRRGKMPDIDTAMQNRCIYCKREQYAMAVYAISQGEHPCVWCGKTPPKMSYGEYRDKYNCGRTND